MTHQKVVTSNEAGLHDATPKLEDETNLDSPFLTQTMKMTGSKQMHLLEYSDENSIKLATTNMELI